MNVRHDMVGNVAQMHSEPDFMYDSPCVGHVRGGDVCLSLSTFAGWVMVLVSGIPQRLGWVRVEHVDRL